MGNRFSVGDVVRCLPGQGVDGKLEVGKLYVVVGLLKPQFVTNPTRVELRDAPNGKSGWYESRFEATGWRLQGDPQCPELNGRHYVHVSGVCAWADNVSWRGGFIAAPRCGQGFGVQYCQTLEEAFAAAESMALARAAEPCMVGCYACVPPHTDADNHGERSPASLAYDLESMRQDRDAERQRARGLLREVDRLECLLSTARYDHDTLNEEYEELAKQLASARAERDKARQERDTLRNKLVHVASARRALGDALRDVSDADECPS